MLWWREIQHSGPGDPDGRAPETSTINPQAILMVEAILLPVAEGRSAAGAVPARGDGSRHPALCAW